MQMEVRWNSNAQLFSLKFAAPTKLSQSVSWPEPEKLETGMSLQVASNEPPYSLRRVFSPSSEPSEPSAKEIRRLHRSLA